MSNNNSTNDSEDHEDSVEARFENLYPDYNYALESSNHEKDSRKRKRMKTMY
ncbi:hypothetical protein [Candidatus Nitrosopumilus sediminis]|uniref:hypothetical protein n=1 Tax=Candidatus Nitrosopumilus sediminis TaxID=1229909 RepID=UPI000374C14A|nr:hypothetical protein [Candidatus Nitrosopumilus sediminis]